MERNELFNMFEGPLTAPYGIECTGFLSVGEGVDPSWPDFQLMMTAAHPGIDNGLQIASLMGLKRKVVVELELSSFVFFNNLIIVFTVFWHWFLVFKLET